jgi:hypothetical protein
MREMTKLQEYFIELLNALGIEKDMIVGIMLLLTTEDQIIELTDFLDRNREATRDEIIEEAIRISERDEA